MVDYDTGRRLAQIRARRGMTQESLAEAAGLHPNTIRKVEQGGACRMETLHMIARALGVETMVFVTPSMVAPDPIRGQERRDLVLADLRGAIVPPVGLGGVTHLETVDEGEPNLDRLGRAVRSLVTAYHDDEYDQVSQLAPGLIRSAHYHVGAVEDRRRRDAVRLRGDVLGLTGRYLIQIREIDLGLIALRDAIRDAEEVGDQGLAVSIIGTQTWGMLRQARFSEVERLCAAVADQIEPRMSDASAAELSAWGWMLMRAAGAAARNNRPAEANEYLSMATAAAVRVGSELQDLANYRAFGPLTVAIKAVETEVVAGRPDRALERAGQLPLDAGRTTPPNWHRHQLDRARALVQTGQTDKATEVLAALRRQAPDWMRHQRLARDVVRELLGAKKRSLTEDQRGLADFLGVEL